MPRELERVRVELTCPRCHYRWHAATIVPAAWWAAGVTPTSIAAICYCPKCEAPPPMQVDDGGKT